MYKGNEYTRFLVPGTRDLDLLSRVYLVRYTSRFERYIEVHNNKNKANKLEKIKLKTYKSIL